MNSEYKDMYKRLERDIRDYYQDEFEEAVEEVSKKRAEQIKKETAINFHKKGIDNQTIMEALNITKEKLEEYLNSTNEA